MGLRDIQGMSAPFGVWRKPLSPCEQHMDYPRRKASTFLLVIPPHKGRIGHAATKCVLLRFQARLGRESAAQSVPALRLEHHPQLDLKDRAVILFFQCGGNKKGQGSDNCQGPDEFPTPNNNKNGMGTPGLEGQVSVVGVTPTSQHVPNLASS